MTRILLFSIGVLVLFTSCETLLFTFTPEQKANFQVEGEIAYVNGTLGKKGHKAFLKMVENHPEVNTLVLQEMPGSLNDEWNVQTCKKVRELGMTTYLEKNSVIQSGAVDLFIAGVERKAEEGAMIGVHSWTDGEKDGKEYPVDSDQHDIFVDYFDAIDRDTSFYWFTLHAAPADGMHFMTKEEIDEYEVVTEWVN